MKAKAGAGANTRITPARAMAQVIDKKLLSELNHFSEVSKEDGDAKRYGPLPSDVFKASLRVKKLPEGEKELHLGTLVGQDVASWWSPQGTNLFKPLAQKLVARDCFQRGILPQAKYAWLSQLAMNNMKVRRKGESVINGAPWFVVIGNVLGCITKAWRLQKPHNSNGFGVRRNGRKLFVCFFNQGIVSCRLCARVVWFQLFHSSIILVIDFYFLLTLYTPAPHLNALDFVVVLINSLIKNNLAKKVLNGFLRPGTTRGPARPHPTQFPHRVPTRTQAPVLPCRAPHFLRSQPKGPS